DLYLAEPRRAAAAARPATDPVAAPAAARLRGCPAADLDVVVWGRGGVTCLENRLDARSGKRTLVAFPESGVTAEGGVRTAAVADLDADGQLDLVTVDDAGLRLFVRRKAGMFAAATDPGTLPPLDFQIEAIHACDWDRDVDVDLVVVGGKGVGWVENLRHGQFRWQPFPGEAAAATALDLIDADGDASWDLLVAGPEGIRLVPSKRSPDGVIRTGPAATVAAAGPLGVAAWDYDNDGVLDLAAWGDAGLGISRGLPGGSYDRAAGAADMPRRVIGFDAADLDADGDLDAGIISDEGVSVLENRGGNTHHWIAVDLEAQQIKGAEFAPSGRVNAHGIGGLLELKAGTSYQPRVVRRRTTHFGLGTRTEADAVRVTWLNGVPQNIVRPPADLLVCEQQILLGSCPYLYAWNGREFAFVTDLLWAAPLGLKRSDDALMPAREWEYVKIPGDSLVPRDGRYEIRITEELWEAAYFDLVRLVVVDHPAEVQVETNEKVGPAEIARFKIHTARRPRPPRAARDHRGRDVLPELAAADGVYLRPAAAKRTQGLLEEHAVELDLGPLADPDRLTLFLRGWMFPTTVGLNLALSRDEHLGTPVPPSLAVPDGSGGWKTVLPFMGFPGGKTKTIAVDLSRLVPPLDPRVRIVTSMEIAWDAAWITCGEESEPIEVVEVCPESADLHPRGVSAIEHVDGGGPERFRYDAVEVGPRWPAMLGCFTRYGTVTDLLAEQDDLLVVMGAGDEATLRFPVPPGPRPGWKRDFLLHSVGWDKDANLATVAGQSVEPLPFTAMRSYPPRPDDAPATSPARAAWLRDRQTRRQGDDYWRAIRPLPDQTLPPPR
ncbi:MAG: CRTAC1 family protein, partial [Planctomycetia bacterium]